jgi:integral membrane sensor domain MASE1
MTSNQDRADGPAEEIPVKGEELIGKVKQLIHEGNVRRVTIKNEKGETIVELPLTFGVVGALIAPTLAAVGAIAALVTDCTITIERTNAAAD